MYYNKFILYYADPPYTEGGGGDPSIGNGNGNGNGNGGDLEDGSDNGNGGVDEFGNFISAPGYVATGTNGKIYEIYDNKRFAPIKPSGETRTISIKGTEKSKFSLTIKIVLTVIC